MVLMFRNHKIGDIVKSENIDSIIRAFKNTVEELFLVSEGMDRPYVDMIDESIIYTLGSSVASFYDAGGYNIAQYLDPEQKEVLADAAVKSGMFSAVKPYSSDDADDINSSLDEGWNVTVGEDSFDLYNIIKSHSSITLGRNKPESETYGSIYVYEFMDWLHFNDERDKKNYEKLKEAIYEESVDVIDNQKKQVLDDFFESSLALPGDKRSIKIIYFEAQKKRIKESGFSDKIFENLSFFDKYFDLDSSKNKELYNTAFRNISTLVIPDNNHLFIPSLRNIYKYFGEFSRTMETVLDVYISKKLKSSLTEQKDVIDLFTALGVRSNISDTGYEDTIIPYLDKPFDNLGDLFEILEDNKNSDELPGKIKKSVLGYLKNYLKCIDNVDGRVEANFTSIGAIGDYIDACRAFFGDDFDFMVIKDSAVKSLEKGGGWGRYVNPWDSVVPLTEGMSSDMKKLFWHEIFEEVKDRFYRELESDDFDAIPFLNEVMGPDAEPLKEALREQYVASSGAFVVFSQYTDDSPFGFLSLVNNYLLVCGEYPERFIEGFQRNIGGIIDEFISEGDRLENYEEMQSYAERINDALRLLGKPVLKLLPELGKKIHTLSEVDPELSQMLIPREWIAEKKINTVVS